MCIYRRLLVAISPETVIMNALCYKAIQLAEACKSSIILLHVVVRSDAATDKSHEFKMAHACLLELGRSLVVPQNDLAVVYAPSVFEGVRPQVNERKIDLLLLDKQSMVFSDYIEKLPCDVIFVGAQDA